jgi:cupin 2 domain-containing protein
MATLTNLLANIPADLPEEIFQTLVHTPTVRVERIVSLGHVTPGGAWLDEEKNEWVLLLQGAARLVFEGEAPIDLLPGSFVNIAAHARHRIAWTAPDEPTIWLAIHY